MMSAHINKVCSGPDIRVMGLKAKSPKLIVELCQQQGWNLRPREEVIMTSLNMETFKRVLLLAKRRMVGVRPGKELRHSLFPVTRRQIRKLGQHDNRLPTKLPAKLVTIHFDKSEVEAQQFR